MPTQQEITDLLSKIKVVSDDEAEACAYVVCVLATAQTPFDDNELGTCCKCQRAVQFRPHAPKKPPRICMECIVKEPPERLTAPPR